MAQLLKIGYPVRGIDDAGQHKVAAYYAVPLRQADIQAAILAFGPLVIAMAWDDNWFHPWPDGSLPAPSGKSQGGHAIEAIGWDFRGLRLRNSWGTTCPGPTSATSGKPGRPSIRSSHRPFQARRPS
jgi:hypothetical protein